MQAFNIPANPEKSFFYSIGTVQTTKAWYKPTEEKLAIFINDMKNIENYEKYNLFLVGGVVNGGIGKTNDVDIIINGNIENFFVFEKFLHNIHDLGLNKHRLLIDAKWIDDVPSCTLEAKKYRAVQFGKVYKQIGEQVSEINLFTKNIKLSDNLVLRDIYYPSEKTKRTNNKFIKV
jgi:hypothetical protein